MRRRLDIAASIVVTPDLLFLDEPTTGLDPGSRNELWEIGVYVSTSYILASFVFLATVADDVELRPEMSEVLGASWWDPRRLPQPRRTITSAALGDALAGVRGVYREAGRSAGRLPLARTVELHIAAPASARRPSFCRPLRRPDRSWLVESGDAAVERLTDKRAA